MSASHVKEPWPPRPVLLIALAGLLMIVLGMGWMMYNQFTTSVDKNTAQSNSVTMAQDIRRICKTEGKLMVDDRDLCAKGEAVLKDPTQAISGPKGDKGTDGEPGKTGPIGPVGATGPKGDTGPLGPFGPKGDKGSTGDDGLPGLPVPGEPGTDGAPGTMGPVGPVGPVGQAGEPGKDGAPGTPGADGAPGKDGVDGKDGRGVQSQYCGDDGRWAITYTDGTTHDGGVCRTDPAPPLGVTP